ncbi:MAG: hypothetical protein QM729_17250 [Solirubrobacterales bacterium]
MSTQPTLGFGPPLIGQTEKALNAILMRELDDTDLSERGWVLLRLAGAAGGRLGREELIERAESFSKFAAEDVEVEIGRLVWSELLVREGDEVVVTAAARELQERVQTAVAEVTARLWGDLPEADLATAGQVLGTVLSRANAELGYSI